jgi:glycine cleavage system H protein
MSTLIGLIVILLLFAVSGLVKMFRKRCAQVAKEHRPMHMPRAPFGTFVDAGHSWVRMMSDGTMRIGIDEFLAESLGAIDGVDLPKAGTVVERGQPLLHVRFGDKRVAVLSPLSGEVVACNPSAESSPLTLSCDPYGIGWAVSLRTPDHKEAIRPLFIGNSAMAFLKTEFTRLADFLVARNGQNGAIVMADGGPPQHGAIAELDKEEVHVFAEQFLQQ